MSTVTTATMTPQECESRWRAARAICDSRDDAVGYMAVAANAPGYHTHKSDSDGCCYPAAVILRDGSQVEVTP